MSAAGGLAVHTAAQTGPTEGRAVSVGYHCWSQPQGLQATGIRCPGAAAGPRRCSASPVFVAMAPMQTSD